MIGPDGQIGKCAVEVGLTAEADEREGRGRRAAQREARLGSVSLAHICAVRGGQCEKRGRVEDAACGAVFVQEIVEFVLGMCGVEKICMARLDGESELARPGIQKIAERWKSSRVERRRQL